SLPLAALTRNLDEGSPQNHKQEKEAHPNAYINSVTQKRNSIVRCRDMSDYRVNCRLARISPARANLRPDTDGTGRQIAVANDRQP
ncbi:MAG: hypothetical protein ACREA2_21315, partial [Blastocatellia bacterium]